MYQDGKWDQFYYQYLYDADNRLIKALSSRNNFSDPNLWITEASYRYYLHGPLARMELGNDKVQGVDYVYTLQGWLKGVNSQVLSPDKDMGNDGKTNTPFANVGRDVFGFSLGYYENDYKSIANTTSFSVNYQYGTGSYAKQLFNGNIGTATYALSKISNGQTTGYAYSYDQLNRIKEMNQHNINVGATTWSNANATTAYKEQISYDANGNILTYKRNAASGIMDDMSYAYNKNAQGRLVNNKLRHVNDGVDANAFTEDIDNQQNDNYRYDKIGNLVSDKAEKIERIGWNVYGKISSIKKMDSEISYSYDAGGNRITKTVNEKKDFYVRDAQGNVLALYEFENSSLKWAEQHLYGSSRIGVVKTEVVANGLASDVYSYTLANDPVGNGIKGKRVYELSNHLGNVMATITDRKIGVDVNNDGQVDHFEAEVLSQTDYYPFGMKMKERSYGVQGRYGFNGKENDNETGWQDYGMRIYDRRLGRFLSVDPLMKSYPMLTPYQFASNMPIIAIDLDGAEAQIQIYQNDPSIKGLPMRVETSLSVEKIQFSLKETGELPEGDYKMYPQAIPENKAKTTFTLGNGISWTFVDFNSKASNKNELLSDPKFKFLNVAISQIGVSEFPGKKVNSKISTYHKEGGNYDADENDPWCSSFLNYVMLKGNPELGRTNSAASNTWYLKADKIGLEKVDKPFYGSIMVRSDNGKFTGGTGHVALVIGEQGGGYVQLGGNQAVPGSNEGTTVNAVIRSPASNVRYYHYKSLPKISLGKPLTPPATKTVQKQQGTDR